MMMIKQMQPGKIIFSLSMHDTLFLCMTHIVDFVMKGISQWMHVYTEFRLSRLLVASRGRRNGRYG